MLLVNLNEQLKYWVTWLISRIVFLADTYYRSIQNFYSSEKGTVSFLLFLCTALYIAFTLRNKTRQIGWPTYSLYIYHLLIVSGLGWLLTLGVKDAKWIKVVLELWPIVTVFIYFAAAFYLKEWLLFWKSAKKIGREFFRAVYFVLLLMIAPGMAAQAWEPIDKINIGILLFFLFYQAYADVKIPEPPSDDPFEESDREITERKQLFPTREVEFNRIKRYITQMPYREAFAFAIHAPYGEGKSSLVNVLLSELVIDKNKTLYLKPTISDSKDKLIEHFFKQLEKLLKESGIYTGKGSSFQRYLEQIGKLLENKKLENIARLLDIFEPEKTDDFRQVKKRLESDIHTMLSVKGEVKQRLYVVVDDFDRAEKQTIYETLIFVKELVDFKGCCVLFLLDYDKVVDQKIDRDYLDKFIGKRFDLEKLGYKEILAYYIGKMEQLKLSEGTLPVLKEEAELLTQHIQSYINEAETALNVLVEKKKNDFQRTQLNRISDTNVKPEEAAKEAERLTKQIKSGEIELKQFTNKINNPRKLKRLLREVKEIFGYFNHLYEDRRNPYLDDNWRYVNLHRLIFNCSLVKCIMEEQHEKLLKSGNIADYMEVCDSQLIRFHLLQDVGKTAYRELEQSVHEIKIKLYQSIFFQRLEDEPYLKELLTQTQKVLAILDSTEALLIEKSIIVQISDYIEAVKRQRFDVDKELTRQRLRKVAKAIFALVDQGLLRLPEVLEWVDHRVLSIEILTLEPLFLEMLSEKLRQVPVEFINENERAVTLYKLNRVESDLIHFFLPDVQMAVDAYFLDDRNKMPVNYWQQLKSVDSLLQLSKIVYKLFSPEIESGSEDALTVLSRFKKNFERLLKETEIKHSDDLRVLRSIQYSRERTDLFARLYSLSQNILMHWNNGGLINPYESAPNLTSLNDAEKSFQIMHDRIVIRGIDADNSNTYHRFHQLLVQTLKVKGTKRLSQDIAVIVLAVYNKLNEQYYPHVYDERDWLKCGLLLSELLFVDNRE